jgi:site-specific DNA-methyltransferase (adenine-specific)
MSDTAPYIVAADAETWLPTLADGSIDLLLIDPPYYGILKEKWDRQWPSALQYVDWLLSILELARPKLAPRASLVMFGALGKHNERPLFDLMGRIERRDLLRFRNWVTWGKKRAYGKSHDYLFTREEIVWYSVSAEREEVTFNIPLLAEKRGYAGFSEKYPAKSEYKRVTNVWSDLPELFRPNRPGQKPLPVIDRLVRTHSNPGDLVVDCFAGWGTTGISARRLGRRFLGCELDASTAADADARVRQATPPDPQSARG